MIKRREIESNYSCLNKAEDSEMLFVLRAQDKLAPLLIRLWADLAEIHGCNEDKVNEARQAAHIMECWYNRKFPD